MAQSAFCDVIVHGLFALACSRLTITKKTSAVCEGFVQREGHVYVATDKVGNCTGRSIGVLAFADGFANC